MKIRHVKPFRLCAKCGVIHTRKGPRRLQPYCHECHAAWARKNRPKHRDLPPLARKKANARAYANVYQSRGKLVPQPCKCGAAPEKHHPDYDKPLAVEWMCRACHLKLHASE
jgi:hypothetical protein